MYSFPPRNPAARPRPDDERGAAAVEFALVLLPLLTIVFGLIQYGWYFYAMQSGTSATSAAVRELSVGDCQDSSKLSAFVIKRLGGASLSDDTVQITTVYRNATLGAPPMSAPGVVGGEVEITLRFQTADLHFPFIPIPDDGVVTRTAVARVEDTQPSTNSCQ
ncbi:hypothetical protein GCM10027020_01920 [Nocardioides salsibiostraticola]